MPDHCQKLRRPLGAKMNDSYCILAGLQEPIAAAAIHDGHALRPDVEPRIALDAAERLREEDPYTAGWTALVSTRLIGVRSRFEMDLNRPREQAVYQRAEDEWGLDVWKSTLPASVVCESLVQYDAFYADAERTLRALQARWGRFIVLDLHTYSHRRNGPDAEPDDPALNPEINIGTGTMDRDRWAPVVNHVVQALAAPDAEGRERDVRENVKFRGGQFSRWVHETFPESGCSIAMEFRKSFMNEWTGVASTDQVRAIRAQLASMLSGMPRTLRQVP